MSDAHVNLVAGKIFSIGETETVGTAGFKKRMVVVETDEQYKQLLAVDFVQAKTTELDKFKVGDNVKISVNYKGREYQGKYYVNFNGWRIEAEIFNVVPSAINNNPSPTTPAKNDVPEDDLPF